MRHERTGRQAAASLVAVALSAAAHGGINPPDGFNATPITDTFFKPVAMAFAPDGRLFIAQQDGVVKVVVDGKTLPTPFIDLRNEVNFAGDRGMLGLALDPGFLENRLVYLLYTVDPVSGQPDEPAQSATFARLTRYQGTASSNGNVADLSTRTVLIGQQPDNGIPVCWSTHTIGALRFGLDGSLFVSTGDGAKFIEADGGGQTPECEAYLQHGEDIGAFRSQSLDSLAGKILRIHPDTAAGLPDNPHFDGDPYSTRSRIWASGLRNPFRFTVRPGSPPPGVIFTGDVGWNTWEELSAIVMPGSNLGWPCYEAQSITPTYPTWTPPSGGCQTINTPDNPGVLVAPMVWWHHSDFSSSFPEGLAGRAAICGVFHSGNNYPAPYRNGLFFADHVNGWIDVLKVDANNQYQAVFHFCNGANGVTDFAIDPTTGSVCFLSLFTQQVIRFDSFIGPGDVTRDGSVDVEDLLAVISNWGPCPKFDCPADLDGGGDVNVGDLLEVINYWAS